ncbi:hypothetical protein KHU50_010487 [Colletotrichum sp. SAR 10_65]|nr:hypothetical protein KHU50_010487 [Colletotrichum sp. SAR 10_65]KAI8177953.1 hypothetical protein K4K51_004988 [Colletotrichum sp. SAR 10_75]KAI8203145.1 hypothetical protein K4K52_005677 [Colletotrichum sp. SAR 10_76]KAI8264489.1 hypothetical protein K4K58_012170 [Colletotrichum sp. SAR11_239]KAJ4996928.1 hypothetical protein K4K48_007658 [Colletotrichum sp. SAR 10_66]
MTLKNFKFSAITRVEDRKDKLKEDMETVKHLGMIEVVVYKSGTILENEGIIQRDDLPEASEPPRLSPLHDNLTIDDLSQEKIRQLAQERLDDLHAVKREEKLKREGGPHSDTRPSKVYKVDSDGAIDLTDE